MFIYSLRASTLKFFCVMAVSCAALFGLMILSPGYEAAEAAGHENTTVNYENIRTNEDRIAFIAQFGYQVESEAVESCTFTLPNEFDRALAGYNEIQKQQGLDLSRYRKKEITRYTYTVTNYPDYEGKVYINLLQHRDRIVGCDICSADPSGFVDGLFVQE